MKVTAVWRDFAGHLHTCHGLEGKNLKGLISTLKAMKLPYETAEITKLNLHETAIRLRKKMKKVQCPHCKALFKWHHVCRKLKNQPSITRGYVFEYAKLSIKR